MLATSVTTAPLPLALHQELEQFRREAELLAKNGKGRRAAGALAEKIGMLLVREARRPAGERGYRMLELSLFVDQLFPELRDLHDREVTREGRQHQEQVRLHRQVAQATASRRGA